MSDALKSLSGTAAIRAAALCAAAAAATALAPITAAGAETAASNVAPLSCYRKVGVAVPQPVAINLVLIDTTTPRDAAAADSLSAHLRKLLSHRGEQVMVYSFAGLAVGEFPREVARAYQEPAPGEAIRRDRVIADVEKLDRCLPKLWAQNLTQLVADAQRQVASSPAGQYSEIVYALRWLAIDVLPALAPSIPVRVFVYSDGLEFSKSGRSFYANKLPRTVDADKELSAVVAAGLGWPEGRSTRGFDLFWLGLGAMPGDSKLYLKPADLEALKAFWLGLALRYGAKSQHIGLTVATEALK